MCPSASRGQILASNYPRNPFNPRFKVKKLQMSTSSHGRDDLQPGAWLEAEDFERVVRLTPLVSIDMVVRSQEGHVLLGRRKNDPARNSFFVPGGRITKNESLEAAFQRITLAELGLQLELKQARFFGVYEHIYQENVFRKPGFGTHYVVLAYELALPEQPASLPTAQHEDYVWKTETEVLAWSAVHENTKAYFRGIPPDPVPQRA